MTKQLPVVAESVLMVMDVQQRLAAAMPARVSGGHLMRMSKLVQAAAKLDIPVVITQQSAHSLGATLPAIKEYLPSNAQQFDKTIFNASKITSLVDHLRATNRHHLILLGIETHIAIAQTALGFFDQCFRVDVVSDATLARHEQDHTTALDYLRAAGVGVSSFEMILFSWIANAANPAFKDLSGLANQRDQ